MYCPRVQYNELMKKKRIVENDKAKILQTIEELDQKKNVALNVAWQKVCSTILRGANPLLKRNKSHFCGSKLDYFNKNHYS